VVLFVQHVAYYRGLQARLEEVRTHRDFWRATCDAHLKLATISWCNVFGSNREDLHWTKTPAGEITGQAAQEFRESVLSHTGLTQGTWEAYHKSMLAFRDKYVAHLDLRVPFAQLVPSFDPAIHTAYVYQEWTRNLIRPVLLNQPVLKAEYAKWERDACSVIGTSGRTP